MITFDPNLSILNLYNTSSSVPAVANATAYLSLLYGHNSFEFWSCKG